MNFIMDYILSFLNMTSIPNWITAIAAIWAAFIAWRGLATWKKELKGKSEYDIAKQVFKAVYKVRNAFIKMRNPIYPFEYPDNLRKQPELLTPEQNYQLELHVYKERGKDLYEAFGTLEEQNINAQVEWGKEFQNIILPLRECRNKLYETISSELDSMQYSNDRLSEKDKNDIQVVLRPIYEPNRQDAFTLQIEAAIAEFEKILRPHIGK